MADASAELAIETALAELRATVERVCKLHQSYRVPSEGDPMAEDTHARRRAREMKRRN